MQSLGVKRRQREGGVSQTEGQGTLYELCGLSTVPPDAAVGLAICMHRFHRDRRMVIVQRGSGVEGRAPIQRAELEMGCGRKRPEASWNDWGTHSLPQLDSLCAKRCLISLAKTPRPVRGSHRRVGDTGTRILLSSIESFRPIKT